MGAFQRIRLTVVGGGPGLSFVPTVSRVNSYTGGGDTTRPGHVANDYNLPVPPQADFAPRLDGEDTMPDPDL